LFKELVSTPELASPAVSFTLLHLDNFLIYRARDIFMAWTIRGLENPSSDEFSDNPDL